MVALLLSTVLTAHTFHTSIAQIDHIAKRKAVEVIVWIHAEDIENLYKQRKGRNATLDRQKEAERFVQGYLKENFNIVDEKGRPLPVKWVGLEVRTHFIAAYFEVVAAGLAELSLRNSILLTELHDQVNVVKVKQDGTDRRDLQFDNAGSPAVQPLLSLQPR